MRDHGWIEGQNVVFEYRWTAGDPERSRVAVAELIDLNVDLLIIWANTPATLAAKAATRSIPVVFLTVTDPVGVGVVESLTRPGGNLTGFTDRVPGLVAKQVELLRAVVPRLSHVAILWQTNNPSIQGLYTEVHDAARSMGLPALSLGMKSTDELEAAFALAAENRVDGLCVINSGLLYPARARIIDLAARSRLPAIYSLADFVPAGGLMAYGVNFPALVRRAPDYVDKILRGTKPADLPVEGPTTFDFVINLKTAQALGLTVPQSVLTQATEVIQ